MADPQPSIGPTGHHVAANVERLRKAHGMSRQALSDQLETIDRTIPVLGLSRIEKGARRVDVDDLIALAKVFDVAPAALLLPPADNGEPVDTTGGPATSWRLAWEWNAGEHPLYSPHADDDPRATPGWAERRSAFIRASRPHENPDPMVEVARFLNARIPGEYRVEIERDDQGATRTNLSKETSTEEE